MRGPHGQRLAADTVHTRAGKERGSGFRWWSEQLNIPADVKWNPQQVVTGVMGLGSLGGTSASDSEKKSFTQSAKSLLRQANACAQSACPEVLARASAMRRSIRAYDKWETSWWNPSSLIGDGPGYDDWQVVDGNLQAAEVAASRRSQGREVPKGAQHGFINPADAAGGTFRREVATNANEMAEWVKANWWKIALGVGGVVVLTGAAKGVGAGFAAKRL